MPDPKLESDQAKALAHQILNLADGQPPYLFVTALCIVTGHFIAHTALDGRFEPALKGALNAITEQANLTQAKGPIQ